MATKRSGMTLDLNSGSSVKKAKFAASQVLTSPDVQMLKLTSPELADFLTRNPSLATPTPSGTGAILCPKTVTEEQEIYANGFVQALEQLHKNNANPETLLLSTTNNPPSSNSNIDTAITTIERATLAHQQRQNIASPPPAVLDANNSRPSSGASGSFDSSSLDGSYMLPEGIQVKEEPGIAGSSNDGRNVLPINMENQEVIKLERKRLRNRVAASKCRKRKLERISQLDDKVNMLKGENCELAAVVKKLKESVCNLKQEVIEHLNSGCDIMISDMSSTTTSSLVDQ